MNFGPHVAADARDRRAPGEVFVGEPLDDVLAKGALVVEDVMREAQPVGHRPRVANIVAGAARALASVGGAVVIELQRDADHLGPAVRGQRGDDRAVDPAGHGDDDPAVAGGARQVEQRGRALETIGGGHGAAALTPLAAPRQTPWPPVYRA